VCSISKHSFTPTANTDSTVRTFHNLGHNTSTYILSDKPHYSSRDGRQRSDRRQSASTRGRLLLAVLNGAADVFLLLASHETRCLRHVDVQLVKLNIFRSPTMSTLLLFMT